MANACSQAKVDWPVPRHMAALVDAIVLIVFEAALVIAMYDSVVLTLHDLRRCHRYHASADRHVSGATVGVVRDVRLLLDNLPRVLRRLGPRPLSHCIRPPAAPLLG